MPRFIEDLTAAQVACLVRDGQLSAREVALTALDAVDQRDAEIHAFLQVTPELALAAADRARGPLLLRHHHRRGRAL